MITNISICEFLVWTSVTIESAHKTGEPICAEGEQMISWTEHQQSNITATQNGQFHCFLEHPSLSFGESILLANEARQICQ